MRFTDNAAITTDNMATDDILAGTDVSASADKKFSLANLANWFLNKFTGLSLAGSQQTVKSALDSLNSNLIVPPTAARISVNSDLNDYKTEGVFGVASDSDAATIANIPRNASGKLIVLIRGVNRNYATQYYITTSGIYLCYIRNYNNGTWTDWELQPRRVEMDAATAATTITQLRNTDLNTLTEPMRIYYAGGSHGCTNVPASAASFGLVVLQISSGYRAQICISSGLNVYIRRYASDSWGSWFEFAKSAIS